MVTFSFCLATDTCLQDQWNYIDMPCSSDWIRGKDLRIVEDCKAKKVDCLDFTSSPDKVGKYFNRTWTLPELSYCTVHVTATDEVARVVFDNTSYLGVEWTDYMVGNVIDVENGN